MGFKNAMSSRENHRKTLGPADLTASRPTIPSHSLHFISVLFTHSIGAESISKERVQQEEGGISERGAEKASEADIWFRVFALKQVLEPRIESLAQRLSFQ
jgi:hypothetical protein